ncbi:hypothetical protein EV189_0615 [Motilibacter rhizosphaerae]|uniref:Uncharacterized protein n=1 Tax=Motilibacter rhizosphaerae TaxID=598652 RepID=A0A4Q7NW32_9ACTN|nr:T3SS effector HopA1 family protein [Motilibacter rhizosphaerae]RZS91374.1 hypothetical protein EV189_0615 [Motilibacter rhizosphaerae]
MSTETLLRAVAAEPVRDDDLPRLTRHLYRTHYLGGEGEAAGAAPAADTGLLTALRRADGGRSCWEPGWAWHDSTGLLVERRGIVLRASLDEVRASSGGGLDVRFPTARPYASPGFFLVSGRAGLARGSLVRTYVAVRPDAAPALLDALVGGLDALGMRFTCKVLSSLAAYPRPDAAVLYVDRGDLPAAWPVVRGAHAALAAGVDDRVPALARRLARGLAVAEDPSQEHGPVSFGQHRCGLLARGLLAAGAGATSEERYAAARAALVAAGIRLDAPHLNPGSSELVVW